MTLRLAQCARWQTAMVNSRNKGANFERELAKLLFEELGLTFKRDIEQYRAADHGDLICVEMPDFPFQLRQKVSRRIWHPARLVGSVLRQCIGDKQAALAGLQVRPPTYPLALSCRCCGWNGWL